MRIIHLYRLRFTYVSNPQVRIQNNILRIFETSEGNRRIRSTRVIRPRKLLRRS